MKPLVSSFCGAFAAAFLSAGPAQAQTLTFDEAMKQAAERNLDLKAAQAKLTQAKEISSKVWAMQLPQLSAQGAYTRNSVEAKIALPSGYYIRDVLQPQGPPFNPAQEIGLENPPGMQTSLILFPSSFVEAVIQPKDQLGGQVQLSQALVAPALWPAIRNAHLGEQVAELGIESAKREVLFAVAQLYYGAAGLKEALAVQEKLVEMHRRHADDAKHRYSAGAASRLELLRAQVDQSKAEQDVQRAKNAYAGLKSSLAALLDREPDFDVERPPAPAFDASVGADAQAAQATRPDVKGARAQLELAEGLRSGTWFKYLPSVGLSGVYRATNAKGFTGTYDSWAVSLGVQWTLWDGGLRESELRETAAKVVEANAQLRSAERKAQDELRRARLDLESALANRQKAQEALGLARESAQIAQTAYAAGAMTYLQVSDASTALLAAELASIGEGLSAQLAVLKLAKAAGVYPPVPE